jgi:hypothetical protein
MIRSVATLDVEDDRVVVRFNGRQAVMALARQVSVPVGSVTGVTVVPDAWEIDLGLRVGGTGVPRRLAFGRFRKWRGPRTFAAVYCGEPAILIETSGGDWDRLAITLEDPEAAARSVREAAGLDGR